MIEPIDERTDAVAKQIVDAAYQIHKTLGPGLLERVYEACFLHELQLRGLKVKSQQTLPVFYKGLKVDNGLRLDLLVEDCVVVELKAQEIPCSVWQAQLLTYLRLSNNRLGLLINFDVELIKQGIKRIAL